MDSFTGKLFRYCIKNIQDTKVLHYSRGKCVETNEMFALKQERPPNLWEFYISLEIHTRIENQNVVSIKSF